MSIKKFTGSTLTKARAEAIHAYGDNFIILESQVASVAGPASITVSVADNDYSIQRTEQVNPHHIKKPQSANLFDPLIKQITRIFEATDSKHNSLSNDGKTLPENVTYSATKEKDGVSFTRSNESYSGHQSTLSPEPEHQEDTSSFKEHFKRNQVAPAASNSNTRLMNRRMDLLKRTIWKLIEDHQSDYTYHPLYKYLRDLGFRPELVIEWFDNWEQNNNQIIDRYSSIAKDIKAEIERYFKPSHPLSDGKTHLFSSFAGTHVINLATAAAKYLERESSGTQIALILSNARGFNKTGRQMFNSLVSSDIPCHYITTHQEWQKFLVAADGNDHIILLTEPMPFNIEIVEERWEHYNRILGEYHSVKHHFTTHSLIDPLEIIDQLPVNHPFCPEFIALSNIEMCQSSYGKLTSYKEALNSEFSFIHTDISTDPLSFGEIEENIENRIFGSYENARYI
ncbi:MAG: hypothetical protein WD491_05850 [Balneolales bacterium]